MQIWIFILLFKTTSILEQFLTFDECVEFLSSIQSELGKLKKELRMQEKKIEKFLYAA